MFVLEKMRQYAHTDKIALINREESLSFGSLDARSDAFAAWLLSRFGNDRTPVVIYGHKQTDFLPCIYGALKAGRAYVPVDFSVPPDRAMEIILDIEPKVIVDFSETLTATTEMLDADKLSQILRTPATTELSKDSWVSGDNVVYILFTSGSTGKPKGVPITVKNLTNFYNGLLPYMPEMEGGVILNQISYSFDVSSCSLYAGLSRGMTLFTVDGEMAGDMKTLFEALQTSGLTMWASTPSFAEICVQAGAFSAQSLPALKSFLFCGEVLTHKLCDQLAERFPEAVVVNTYGPTEATVLVTAVRITDEMRQNERPIPIGYPLEEVELRIVDADGNTVEPDEEPGELLILSKSVGPGYNRRPDLTEQRFFENAATGKRGYRTGDICYRKNGLYYYQGRADNQLKLHGHRIELEDIENNLVKLPNIARAAVVPVWEGEKVQYLTAFLLLEQEDGFTPLKRSIEIKKQAAAFLPDYMIPRKLVAVESFPLNTNGKIDKKVLAEQLLAVKA